jgi:DNA invertase Pin-like site-specific DNA recombinase
MSKKYGYVRISTNKQNIERQVRNIHAADSSAVIVRETYTGTKFQGRRELDKLIKNIKPDDTIYFDSVSRMSRNADEGFAIYQDLFYKGVNLFFIKEPHINTDTYRQAIENKLQIAFNSGDAATDELMAGIVESLNKYIMRLAQKQIQLAFIQSEKEVTDLHQRTREGIVTAKLNGKQIGQPLGAKLITKKSIEAKAKIKKLNKSFEGTNTNEETWKLAGISRGTFYKYKAEILVEVSVNNMEPL